MRPFAAAVVCAVVAIATVRWTGETARAQGGPPRLLVIVVADQLRADYLDAYAHRWRGGFRRLLDEGARYTRAEYRYLNTATCVGHVTIATGAVPRTHGIVLNRWWHRDAQRAYNCMDDEEAPHVSYGAPAQFGSSAKRVLVPTLADALRAQRPGARVVSLALKSRSAIPLAGQGGDVVTWFDEAARAFVTSTAYAREPVPAVSAFIAQQPPERDLGQVWALHDRPETYRFPDLAAGERPKAGWSAAFPHPLIGIDGADAQFFDRWQKSPFSDAYVARMAASLVDNLQLGQRDTIDYLALSFSALDLMGHDFGPDSREVEDLLIALDATLGGLMAHLDRRIGAGNYVLALTADHGAAPTPEQNGGGRIASEDVLQVAEQALIAVWGAATTPYVAWVSSGSVFFATGVADRLRADPAARSALTRALLDIPGMMRVIREDEIDAASSDPWIRAAAIGFVPGRTADLLLVPRKNWVIELRAENEATNHGTFHEYDRRVPIVLHGYRIRRGRYRGDASAADIAPTLAAIAGLRLPSADGRVLQEALR